MPLQIDITPPNISATVGTVVPMSCEVSGVSPVGAFANKPLPSSTLESVYSFANYGSKVYVGTGDTAGTDAKLFSSDDSGANWSQVFSAGGLFSAVHSIVVLDNGNALSFVCTASGGNVGVYKNGSLVSTISAYPSGATNALFSTVFDNGNIVVGVGDSATIGARIFLSTDSGLNWSLVFTGTATAYNRIQSGCKINATTALMTDLYGYVYKTTNSGANWSQVSRIGTTPYVGAIGILGSRLIVHNPTTNSWVQSNDDGSTWVAYVGTAPIITGYSVIGNYAGVTAFGEVVGRRVAINRNDTTWEYYTLPDAVVDRVFQVAIVGEFIYATTGTDSGDGRVYRASAGVPIFKLIDTSDSSILSTVSPYNYTADIADDNKNFKWSVTDGVTTVQSALIPVNVYEELQIVSVNHESVDTTVGQTVVFSCTTSGGDGAVSLELIDTSDDTVLATTSPFSLLIENPISTYFKWVATDGLSTVESALIPVLAVETNTIHETGGIIRGSIGNFKYTPIEKCYNDFSIEYGDGLKISISKVDQGSFPSYILGGWESYVSGIQSYADAKELWTIARNSYILNSRARTAPDERSKLAYSVDRNQFYSTTAYDTTEEYARQYVQLFTEWATRQKLEVKYSLPMTADNAKLELMQVVYFSDVIITPEVGEYGKGWVTSIQCDTENDVVKVGLTFEPDFFLPPSLIVTGDIVETGYSTADIIETGTQTNNIIESGL